MATEVNCPSCGSAVAPGAVACASCGQPLNATAPPPESPAPAPSDPPPADGPTFTKAAVSAPNIGEEIAQMRSRWGVEQTPVLTVAMILVVAAVAVGSIFHTIYLTSDNINDQLDAAVWLDLALGLAIAAAGLAVLIRWQSGMPRATGEAGIDLRVAFAIYGLIAVFCLAGLFKGLDGSFEAQDSWFRFARIFCFVAIAWLAIARPVPPAVGNINATTIGYALLGLAAVGLLLGLVQGLSDNNDTYISGLAWQGVGIVATLLAFGWFLGFQAKRGVTSAG